MSARPKIILSASAIAAMLTALAAFAMPAKPEATPAPQAVAPVSKAGASTADHSKFKELQKNFKTGPEVTQACLLCHTEAAKQVQHTKHWTWESTDPKT
ncbi:MAG: cytochrome C, partial [Gallionella sp.]|nr:cytochrome C [Gallionella sp.]